MKQPNYETEQDPLDHLDKRTTKILDNLFRVTPEDNEAYNQQQANPEYALVERFLAAA